MIDKAIAPQPGASEKIAGSDPKVCIVAAVAENGVIGSDGRLPWRMPADLREFRRLTLDKPLIMGRRTWESLGKPLDRRDNIVVTRRAAVAQEQGSVYFVGSIGDALAVARKCAPARGSGEIMVIGGAQIYAAALPIADRIYLTRVHAEVEGDVVFPDLDDDKWSIVGRKPLPTDERDDYTATLLELERVDAATTGDRLA